MKRLVCFIFIFLLPLAFAGNVTYTIVDKTVLAQFSFGDYTYDIEDLPSSVEILDYTEGVSMHYVTDIFVEKSGSTYFFVVHDLFHTDNEVRIELPPSATLDDRYFVFPRNYSIGSNGQNIILHWNASDEEEILVAYTLPSPFNFLSFLFILVIVGLLVFMLVRFLKRRHNRYIHNLFGEEKKIIAYLTHKKSCWTKELVRELGISKVKLSRRMRSLEEKGLIRREPHGNENRVFLVK